MADNFRFGSWATDSTLKVVVLYATISSGNTGSTFIRMDKLDHNSDGIDNVAYPETGFGAGNGYQVPTGKKYVCTLVRYAFQAATTTYNSIGFADADAGWNTALGSFTNPKSKWGINHTTYAYNGGSSVSTSRNDTEDQMWNAEVFFKIPALKYPFAASNSNCGMWMFGFEA